MKPADSDARKVPNSAYRAVMDALAAGVIGENMSVWGGGSGL
jgi:hypothetical protein